MLIRFIACWKELRLTVKVISDIYVMSNVIGRLWNSIDGLCQLALDLIVDCSTSASWSVVTLVWVVSLVNVHESAFIRLVAFRVPSQCRVLFPSNFYNYGLEPAWSTTVAVRRSS